jgi:hypothetical protein
MPEAGANEASGFGSVLFARISVLKWMLHQISYV